MSMSPIPEEFLPMSNAASVRSWLGPLTGIVFVAIGLSGLLMFLHVRLPGMTLLHELGGLLFVGLAIAHISLNARSLFAHCAKPAGLCAIGFGIVACVVALILGVSHDEHRERGRERIHSENSQGSTESSDGSHAEGRHGRRGHRRLLADRFPPVSGESAPRLNG